MQNDIVNRVVPSAVEAVFLTEKAVTLAEKSHVSTSCTTTREPCEALGNDILRRSPFPFQFLIPACCSSSADRPRGVPEEFESHYKGFNGARG